MQTVLRFARHAVLLRVGLVLAALVIEICLTSHAGAAEEKPHAFEAAIQKFEATDRETPVPERPILFVGGSSIRRWDLGKSFPNLPVINRGFGGSTIEDSVYFADRIVLKYKPRLIVLYAGDNELARGKEPEQAAADFQELLTKVRSALPQTRVVFISIKPSLKRWKLFDQQRTTNALIAAMAKSDPLLTIVEVEKAMLGDDGKPRAELFVKDGLHLSDKGYEIWTSLLMPIVKQAAEQN